LRKEPGIADPIGGALDAKFPDSVDWIFARGLQATHGELKDTGASDHPAALAELRLVPPD
jgi:endonuclease/exonuclease/phosphatase (EEP) superfamily protein YafD